LTNKAVLGLSVCWNDAFRKIFNYRRYESVKELLAYCNELDFVHIYDMARYKFLKGVSRTCPILNVLCNNVKSQFCSLRNLTMKYGILGCCRDVPIRLIFRARFMDSVIIDETY
jgi:hypothetical protein